jgi:UDP-4-amino-4-deoxy-L-arabinose formyltransferase/UDP-glucuronic acid dehydrogenase (UDP-4-keto-hexauronic acid decarboxylating)
MMLSGRSAVVFAYGGFGHAGLLSLLQAGIAVTQVYSHADHPEERCWWESVHDLCRAQGIPVRLDADLASDGAGSERARIRALQPDYLFSFYFRSLLGRGVLAAARRGAYNLHGSLLPLYRGRAPINWQLVHGERQSGLTLHRMVPAADAGDVVAQQAIALDDAIDALGLTCRLLDLMPSFMAEALAAIASGRPETPQDHARATVFPGRRPADGAIDWRWPAARVHNLVRAVAPPWPGATATLGGRTLLIARTLLAPPRPGPIPPGTILDRDQVMCGDRPLTLIDVRPVAAAGTLLTPGLRFDPFPRPAGTP